MRMDRKDFNREVVHRRCESLDDTLWNAARLAHLVQQQHVPPRGMPFRPVIAGGQMRQCLIGGKIGKRGIEHWRCIVEKRLSWSRIYWFLVREANGRLPAVEDCLGTAGMRRKPAGPPSAGCNGKWRAGFGQYAPKTGHSFQKFD